MRIFPLLLALAATACAEGPADPAPLRLLPEAFGPAAQPCLSVAADGTAYAVFGAPKGGSGWPSWRPGRTPSRSRPW